MDNSSSSAKTAVPTSGGLVPQAEALNQNLNQLYGMVLEVKDTLFGSMPMCGESSEGLTSPSLENSVKNSSDVTKDIAGLVAEILRSLKG
ncbi:hypothetical protein M3_0050 [Lysinibacillus phage vB_LfM_LysYB1]|nr:hypothetical protein M3_0050 [Lysinibacillus phage vB_LfM_LysYB1]WAB25207.1 hypothetical protein M5_0029 [Lysinibacillus phage vB_LfM_LysYB2]